MAVFETECALICPIDRVWEFLIRPANAMLVTPPDFHAKLLEGPEVLSLGYLIKVQLRRFCIATTLTSEVTALEPIVLLRDEQPAGGGPMRRWSHTHRLEERSGGCLMVDRIEFEPPGGLMGLMVTEAALLRELKTTFAYRATRFRELLNVPNPPVA